MKWQIVDLDRSTGGGPTWTLLTADENQASFIKIYVEMAYTIKRGEYCHKQPVKLLKG